MAILRLRDKDGNITEIAALRGPKGDFAELTEAEKQQICDMVEDRISPTIESKQDKLQFDTSPAAGSDNPVTSLGILNYVNNEIGNISSLFQTI